MDWGKVLEAFDAVCLEASFVLVEAAAGDASSAAGLGDVSEGLGELEDAEAVLDEFLFCGGHGVSPFVRGGAVGTPLRLRLRSVPTAIIPPFPCHGRRLTVHVSLSLMTRVSESLAGRLSLVEPTPFLLSELKTKASRRRHWLCGGYPEGGVLEPKRYPWWQIDYLSLLAQRDLPIWGLPAKPQVTDRLLRMLAALHGQVWNAAQVGQSLGLSYHTVNNYLDYLIGAFLLRQLPAYQANIRKRLVKRPKLYWRDSGLVHALLNVPDERALLVQPWVGASWEGYVIEQALGELSSQGRSFSAYYFRTSDRHELHLVLDMGSQLWAVNIRLTSWPSTEDITRLNKAADIIKASRRFLVSQTKKPAGNERCLSCDLPTFLEHLRAAGS